MALESVSVPMTLSDLEKRHQKSQTFTEDLWNYAPTVWPTAATFAVVTLVGEERVSMGQTRPFLKSEGPACPKYVGSPTDAQTVWPTTTKFGMARQINGRFSRDQPCPVS